MAETVKMATNILFYIFHSKFTKKIICYNGGGFQKGKKKISEFMETSVDMCLCYILEKIF
jgi:hypothetical protein